MKLNLVLMTFCLGIVSLSFAQKSEKIIKQPTPNHQLNSSQPKHIDTIDVANPKSRVPQLSSSSVENTSMIKNQSLLQELYSIEDERNIIEKDNSLSSSERGNKIEENNSKYNLKKAEFIKYINSKGVLNSTKNEQSYYLSLLKSDKNESEYNRVIQLIKQSN